jgi:hypothetical protein
MKQYEADKHWAMFTKAGNKRINTLANRLIKKTNDLLEEFGDSRKFATGLRNSIYNFLRQYRSMGKFPSYSEATDTAVREEIWAFLADMSGRYEIDQWSELEEIWNDRRGYPKSNY